MIEKMMRVTLIEPENLVIDETAKPKPVAGEILIRVLRCGVCGSDTTIYHGRHPYAKKAGGDGA